MKNYRHMKANGFYLSVEFENNLANTIMACEDSDCIVELSVKGMPTETFDKVKSVFENSDSAREIKLKLAALRVETFDHN